MFILFFILFLLVGLFIAYNVMLIKVQNKAKNTFKKIWESKYKTTKKLGNLYIDENAKKWYVFGYNKVYNYSDILDFEISENGTKYKSKGGITRSVVGGLTFGAAGAVVGASTAKRITTVNSMNINITVDNPQNPLVTIVIICSEVNTSSFTYKNSVQLANQIISQLTYMQSKIKTKENLSLKSDSFVDVLTKVVGATKNNDEGVNIQNILPELEDGSKLNFAREPNNPYDTNAIKVICDYQHIGYIKAELAEEIAPIMDSGKELKGYITQITGGIDGKNYGCNIHISI
jgi:hypothetical protein